MYYATKEAMQFIAGKAVVFSDIATNCITFLVLPD
jgi:hypothetical protein